MMRVPLLPPTLLLGPLLAWLVSAEDCEISRSKCVYRTGCGLALHGYMVGCADVLAGRTSRCTWTCRKALISLMSTDVGQALSTCDCGNNEFCRQSKSRVEICRPEVSHATADDTVVSCSVAEWICAADQLCSTALNYYHRFCKSLFHGKKCTPRCNNSLTILNRQEKAAKLRNCYCDGSEDYPCSEIRANTERLCFGKENVVEGNLTTTNASPEGGSVCSPEGTLLGILGREDVANDNLTSPNDSTSGALSCSPEGTLLGILALVYFKTICMNAHSYLCSIVQSRSEVKMYLKTGNHKLSVFFKLLWKKGVSRSSGRLWPWWWTSGKKKNSDVLVPPVTRNNDVFLWGR